MCVRGVCVCVCVCMCVCVCVRACVRARACPALQGIAWEYVPMFARVFGVRIHSGYYGGGSEQFVIKESS